MGLENRLAQSRDGDILEVLCILAMQIASHRWGLRGVPFHEFVRLVVIEILKDLPTPPISWTAQANNFLLPQFAGHAVPYMIPCNNPWPKGLHRIPNCNVADLRRTRNQDRIDLRVANLTGEAKNCKEGINTNTLGEMLKRIPTDSQFHLIFCSKLQKKYFTGKKKWGPFSDRNDLNTTNVVKIIVNNTNKLEHMPFYKQIPLLHNYDRLVVVFEVDTLCK
jgi:hypothetical protein